MSQFDFGTMDPTATSGTTLATDLNSFRDAQNTHHKGSVAPSYIVAGMIWIDSSVSPWIVKLYDGANNLVMGFIDPSNHYWVPSIGGGINTIAAANSCDIGNVVGGYVSVTGSTQINDFGTTAQVGTMKVVRFTGTPVLHQSSTLVVPTGADLTADVGGTAIVVRHTSSAWLIATYLRADGTAISASAVFTSAVFFNSIISPPALTVSTADYAPTSLATSNTVRVSSTVDLSLTGIAAPATNGKILILENIGTKIITLTVNDVSSVAANRFFFKKAIVLLPDASICLRYDNTTAGWRVVGRETQSPNITVQRFLSGSGNYVPTSTAVTKIFVELAGPGAGGGAGSAVTGSTPSGNTTFGGWSAIKGNGGGGSNAGNGGVGGTGGANGTGVLEYRFDGGDGMQGFGSTGATNVRGGLGGSNRNGGPGAGTAATGGDAKANTGGGGAGGANGNAASGAGGGAGEVVGFWVFNPGTIAYSVPAGGAGAAGTGNGGAGAAGIATVREYYD